MLRILVSVAALLIGVNPAWAQFDINKALQGLSGVTGSGLSDAKIGSGLQEALRVGTENAVNITGQTDGFFKNQLIKILMPKTLQNMEKPLRFVGYGPADR